jgi:hypothetical protein
VSVFSHYECPECEYDMILHNAFGGPPVPCPICLGDTGHIVNMNERAAEDGERPEGFDARRWPWPAPACTYCNGTEFEGGPRGGVAQNIRCKRCGHWFNYSPASLDDLNRVGP